MGGFRMIKMIAIDIDGTLVNGEKVMTERVKNTIKEAMRRGIKIVLCTGRPPAGIKPYADELGFETGEDYIIAQNGAYIIRTDTKEVVYKKTLSLPEVQELYEFGKGFAAGTLLVTEFHYYSLEDVITETMLMDAKLVNMEINVLDPNEMTEEMNFMKILYIGEESDVDVIDSAVPDRIRDNYYVVRSQKYLVEVMANDTNKGIALTKLAEKLGIPIEEVMALGDGENDYEMIQAAGLGVVMSNGTDNLKSIANEITLSNEEDGVAHAIEKWAFTE